ncbi:MAG: ATP-binding protein, partial [Planctomycetota bacterium]
RNRSIEKLRAQERELEEAFSRLEVVANDLKRKNHLLETAKQNLADADRLASLGMMSAGIAHELNTPLAVIKGIVEQMQAAPDEPLPTKRSQLMLRVVNRLERLSEGLLDFARVRPPSYEPALVAELADEAIELVRLERRGPDVQLVNDVDRNLGVRCDADRMVQVLVNLIRNSVDAVKGRPAASVAVSAEIGERDGEPWVSINVTDNGPGIDRGVLPNVFEPFVSTKLDSRGSGLGLAVAEGIVREHGGVILAANRAATSGAVFEIMLPAQPGEAPSAEATQE